MCRCCFRKCNDTENTFRPKIQTPTRMPSICSCLKSDIFSAPPRLILLLDVWCAIYMYPLSWLQATCLLQDQWFSWFLDGSVRVSLAHAPFFSDAIYSLAPIYIKFHSCIMWIYACCCHHFMRCRKFPALFKTKLCLRLECCNYCFQKTHTGRLNVS